MVKRAKLLRGIRWGVGILVLVLVMVALIINRTLISDSLRGMFYRPSEEMILIRDRLGLTREGERIFNASFSVLEGKDEFNRDCKSFDASIYILGCYTEGGIFIYNITDMKFDGIREVTAAHELLHAVYARLSDSERATLSVFLENVYRENSEFLGSELALYDGSERYDELHSRIGTEIKSLPDELEKHYARFFTNQDLIVSYYDKYITPFRELEEEFRNLEEELKELGSKIDKEKANYTEKATAYNNTVAEFNRCAETMGCFKSDAAFRARRAEILDEQAALDMLLNEVNRLVSEYNAKVDKYNKDVALNKELTDVINSNAEIEKIDELSE